MRLPEMSTGTPAGVPDRAPASPGGTVRVRFLGDFRLTLAGRPVERWRAGKTRSLFQYLLVNRGRLVLRDRLYEVLWPGTEWTRNSSSLKVAVHALRQILAALPGSGEQPPMRVLHQDYGYVLHAEGVWIDFEEFDSRFGAARAAESRGESAAALRLYREAAELYTGDFLPGETADWAREQREWSRSTALRAMDRLHADAFARDDYAEVITWCRRILDIDPYREDTYRRLMYVHGRLGELGRVNSWYALCVRRLRDELDVEPATATQRVFRRAIRGELRALAAAPPGPASAA